MEIRILGSNIYSESNLTSRQLVVLPEHQRKILSCDRLAVPIATTDSVHLTRFQKTLVVLVNISRIIVMHEHYTQQCDDMERIILLIFAKLRISRVAAS